MKFGASSRQMAMGSKGVEKMISFKAMKPSHYFYSLVDWGVLVMSDNSNNVFTD